MENDNGVENDKAPWWGVGILYLLLAPVALMAYFALKTLSLVWGYFDATGAAAYAVVVFAVLGTLMVWYLIIVSRQIYIEFIVPKLAKHRRIAQQRKNRE